MSLFAVRGGPGITESALLQRMQWLAETMYHERVIVHYESCSMETLRNAVASLEVRLLSSLIGRESDMN